MKLGGMRAPKGARGKRKRLGAGLGTGKGKTCGKGHKGQNSRSGGGVKPWFEGGQMPIQMRLPKIGFSSLKPANQVVNVSDLERHGLTGEVTIDVLKGAGLITSARRPVKILGQGELSNTIQVSGILVSASARQKIEQAGGSVDGAIQDPVDSDADSEDA